MKLSLASKLIERNLINSGTEVTARYNSHSLDGNQTIKVDQVFLVDQVLATGEKITLNLISTRDGTRRTLPVESVVAIDGMDPARFASVYNIKADGLDAKVGKRRGRKPKDRSLAA